MRKKLIFLFGIISVLAIGFESEKITPLASAQESSFLYPEYSKKISMDFKDALLTDVLKILSQQSDLNFIASQEIGTKKVNLFLNKVPVLEALERILSANDLTYEIEPGSGIYIIKPSNQPKRTTITRVYRLKHASVSTSKINNTIDITTGSSSAGSSAASATNPGGLLGAVKSVLTSSGTLVEDPRTNSFIISDVPGQFPLIEQTLARLDVPIPQILIEVEMLDVAKNTADKLGVKFGETPLTFKGGERDTVYPWNQRKLLDKGYAFEEAEYRVGTISASGLTMALQFLRTNSDTKNLARPRILTLNNQTAQIQIKTDEAIGVKQETQSQDTGGTTTVEAERVETGVFLVVTPQANLTTGEITMAIAPKVIQARLGGTFRGETFRDPEERGTQSILKINDGETIIIGGLLRTDKSKTVTKVPFLGDIPVLGRSFRHDDESEVERELIIFITPHILAENTPTSPKPKQISTTPIIREQDIPANKKQEIDNALTQAETVK